MDKIKQITIKIQPWMAKAAISALLFTMSWAAAASVSTQPDFFQVLRAIFAVLWAIGSVVLAIIAMVEVWDN